MQRDRLQSWWKAALVLYLISFILPVGKTTEPGIVIFLLSLGMGFSDPIFLVIWIANPLFWLGLASLRGARWGRAAALGGASFCASIPSLLCIRWQLVLARPYILPKLCGYFTWLASIALLALISSLMWLSVPGRQRRPQIRLSWLMMAIAAIAVVFALSPPLSRVLRWILALPDGYGVPDYPVGLE
jgi:hypothetical protein